MSVSTTKSMNKKDIEKLLNSPKFIQYILDSLLKGLNHELVIKPRLYFENSKRGNRLLKNKSSLKPGEIKINTKALDYDDEDIDFDEFDEDCYPEDPPKDYFRRDAFLTGGAVAAAIYEYLFKIPKVVNDVDVFYYKFKSKDQSGAEHERYNNLQGEDASYHIAKVKEVGILNFVEINIEDNFTWDKVLNSFDLNYSQVGIVLAEKKIIYTPEFVNFLCERVIKVVDGFEDDFPLTTYIRAVHKAQDFKSKFYDKEILKNYLVEFLGESIFKEDINEFEVTFNRDEADNEEIVLVTEKRFKHWVEHPDILPYLTPQIKDDKKFFKVNLPQEPWVEICYSVFKNIGDKFNHHGPECIHSLEKRIPHFWSLRTTVAKRLKNIIHSKLIPIMARKGEYGNTFHGLSLAIEANPKILKEDFSINKLTKAEGFINTHKPLVQNLSLMLLQKKLTINQVLDVWITLSKFDLDYIGILETNMLDHNHNLKSTPVADKLFKCFIDLNLKSLESELEAIYLKELEKNCLLSKTEVLSIKPFSRWVREIVKLDQLQLEGKNMNHCVGGYANKIKEGHSRIVHIEVNGNHSTLEIGIQTRTMKFPPSKSKKGKINLKGEISKNKKRLIKRGLNLSKLQSKLEYYNAQHRAKYNNNPHRANQKVAELLLKYLNNYQK